MFFLIRMAFWLAIVVAFIPVRAADLQPGERPVSPGETLGIARTVVSDVAGFCARNGDTCATGSLLVSQMGIKAREGAKVVYTFLDERFGPSQRTASSQSDSQEKDTRIDTAATGSVGG